MHLRCGWVYIIALLQTVHRVLQLKLFQNRSIIGEEMDKSLVARSFCGARCMSVRASGGLSLSDHITVGLRLITE